MNQGKLRTISDITWGCDPHLYPGALLNFKPSPGEPLFEQMIDFYLTPGIGSTQTGIIRAIFQLAPFQTSPAYTVKKWLGLAHSGSPLIRTAAFLALRDNLADLLENHRQQALALNQEFGISDSDVERWLAQLAQNGFARIWWSNGSFFEQPPSTSLPADGPTGLALCTNDQALGVPPLAPVIVIARIEPHADTLAGKAFIDHSHSEHPIVLSKVKASIENVLKGSIPTGPAEFFYFGVATSYNGPKKWDSLASLRFARFSFSVKKEASCEP